MRIKLLCGASGKRIWLEILIMGASIHIFTNQSVTYKKNLPFYFFSTRSINCTCCSSPWPACTPCLEFSSSAFFGTRCLERAPPSNTKQKNKVKALIQKKISHAVVNSLIHRGFPGNQSLIIKLVFTSFLLVAPLLGKHIGLVVHLLGVVLQEPGVSAHLSPPCLENRTKANFQQTRSFSN